jgi:hypothetical protein
MTVKRAFVRVFSTPIPVSGWRGIVWLAIAVAIFLALPEARALVTVGFLGGVVIAGFLILIRHRGSSGPRRGTPIVLFPREVNVARELLAAQRRSSLAAV